MFVTVPSYVIPGTYLENVAYLAREEWARIGGVELLFYLFDRSTADLLARERQELERYASRFRFSVHMPDPLLPEHRWIVEQTAGFAERYVVHVPETGFEEVFLKALDEWRERYGDRFLLENLIRREFEPWARRLPDMPVCFDVGHCLLRGESPGAFLERYAGRIAEIHLHSVRERRDHQPLSGDEVFLEDMRPFLDAFSGPLHLELFAAADVRRSLNVMAAKGLIDRA